MSGHNKWSTIKNKKAKTDAAKGKIFTKIGREIVIAVKTGGSADPNLNSKLKDVVAKARSRRQRARARPRTTRRSPTRATRPAASP